MYKKSKSPGIDQIMNEYIKNSSVKMLPLYTNLFNLIMDIGYIPKTWGEGMIIPIYKGQGNPSTPINYRPITLLSCISKLFTSILNNRLNTFLEENRILLENQAAYRKRYSTLDHILTLNSLNEILKHYDKKLYCIFIDFSKAFDSIWHTGLWQKLPKQDITGKFLKIVQSMYSNIKSRVSIKKSESDFFYSNGVRQGETLSPILFSLFLNDLEGYLKDLNSAGVQLSDPNIHPTLYIEILLLMYADDTILISDDPQKLQNTLNNLVSYCKDWKLNTNTEKTKVMVLGTKTKNLHFKIMNKELEIVKSYKYLGTHFSSNGNFKASRLHLADQAKKVMYLLYKRIYYLSLPTDLAFKLFDQTVLPILMYSVEIWGYESVKYFEQIHCNFIKQIFNFSTKKKYPKLHDLC